MDSLDTRFAEITASTGAPLQIDQKALKCLPRAQRAVAILFVKNWRYLEQSHHSLMEAVRVLKGQAPLPARRWHAQPRTSWTVDRNRLFRALIPSFAFVAGFLFWVYTDPPGGGTLPSMTATMSLTLFLIPISPLAFLTSTLVSLSLFVAPAYFLLIPTLSSAYGLLPFIFVYFLLFGYLGHRIPFLGITPTLFFVMMTGIANEQTYSFLGFIDSALVMVIGIIIHIVIQMLWLPGQPRQMLISYLGQFFRRCSRVVGETSARGKALLSDQAATMQLVERIRGIQKDLHIKKMPKEIRQALLDLFKGIECIVFRLQSLTSTYKTYVRHNTKHSRSLDRLLWQLREELRAVLGCWACFATTSQLDKAYARLQAASHALEQALNSSDTDDTYSQDLYVFLGSVRGTLEAVAITQKAIKKVDWISWKQGYLPG